MGKSTDLIEKLESGSVEECLEVVNQFNIENDKAREITWLSTGEKEKLWGQIFSRLKDPAGNELILSPLLNSLRILSREKATLESVMTDDLVLLIMERAGLKSDDGPTRPDNLNGMKVVFNMLFQSEKLQSMFISNGLLNCLVKHSEVSQTKIPNENRYFLLKIFFIITALRRNSGAVIRNELDGIKVLNDLMNQVGSVNGPYDVMTVDIISEVLKVMYNIIHDMFPNRIELSADMFGTDFTLLCQLCSIIRRNLVKPVISPEKKTELSVHSIHILCAVPPECYEELLIEDHDDANEAIVFDGVCMSAVESVIRCLEVKMENPDRGPVEPILLALCKMASGNRQIRRFLKMRILPPLKKEDLLQRPEVGHSIRNKLCSLIHTPSGNSTDVAANLIFILCKENVNKMVKYTGYGNAAGLLANRGLMLGGKENGNYSDDSQESDTEEYTELKNKINDVEGWMKPEAPPVEMTEEQKEFEALKLVETLNKMSCSKTIQPCRIGPDGKPKPMEHVLELQDALDSFKSVSGGGSDSDSD